jgi:hypothetical protein
MRADHFNVVGPDSWQTCAVLKPIKSGELQAGYSPALLNF